MISFRPLPATNVRKFGEWIVQEKWDFLNDEASVNDLAEKVDKCLNEKLDQFCPKKSLKISQRDKPFITTELKILSRRRNREYVRNGKTLKYYELRKAFQIKYKKEAQKYLDNNIEELSHCKPGKSFQILKRPKFTMFLYNSKMMQY